MNVKTNCQFANEQGTKLEAATGARAKLLESELCPGPNSQGLACFESARHFPA